MVLANWQGLASFPDGSVGSTCFPTAAEMTNGGHRGPTVLQHHGPLTVRVLAEGGPDSQA